MIDILERNLSFFRLLRNDKRIIESFDIDNQFTSVIDYLNDVIVPAVNDMQAEALPGIIDSDNYFLTNVGDGSVTFNTLNQVIVDHTIATTKIEKAAYNGKVLVSNNAGELDLADGPTYLNMVLTYRNGDVPIYKFITTENIEDRAIIYADIADKAIIREHLHQEILDILDAAVPDVNEQNNIVITGNYFGDLSITTDKFAFNTIATANKLGIINNVLPPNPLGLYNVVTRAKVKNGTITADKIKPDTVGALNFNKVQCITQNKLASNIVDDTWLLASPNILYLPPVTTSNDSGFFYNDYLAPDFRISRRNLRRSTPDNAVVCKNDFTWEVNMAFTRAGCW